MNAFASFWQNAHVVYMNQMSCEQSQQRKLVLHGDTVSATKTFLFSLIGMLKILSASYRVYFIEMLGG